MDKNDTCEEMARIRQRMAELIKEQEALADELRALEESSHVPEAEPKPFASQISLVNNQSSSAEKIALFSNLFAGRPDVYPVRWENKKAGRAGYSPACANEWVKEVCGKPKVKCGACQHQAFIPVTTNIFEKHLRGGDARSEDFVAGVYPMLKDETCWFLAADFDNEEWADDSRALLKTCRAHGISAALERSRSGNGGHVWIFFAEPVAARAARQLGAALMTETMEKRPEIGFKSYDRFFPNQDTMPRGGFGNLIALPLQKKARDQGNSVFVDDDLRPYEDQWAYLSSLERLPAAKVMAIAEAAEASGRVLGVRMPVEDEHADEPWKALPSRRRQARHTGTLTRQTIGIVLADQVYVDRTELPAALATELIRLAAFQNPEFYRAQAMRMPTFGKPRIISCAELHPKHVALPRGCLEQTLALISSFGAEVLLQDHREGGIPLPLNVAFRGQLQPKQAEALDALAGHDTGVLAATTAFGKTVVAAALIAHR